MATQVKESPKVTNYGATSRPTGGNSFETFSWWFFRVSGVGLVFLAIIHLVLMHVTTDVSETVYDYVANRYANPFWRGYDLLLLTLALFHGLNGLRLICDDYIRSCGWRTAVVSGIFIIAISFWLLGSMTIITFHPNMNVAQSILSMLGR